MRDSASETTLEDLVAINPECLGSYTPSDFSFLYIDLTSVNAGVIDWNSARYLRYSDSPSRARRVTQNGDILLSTVRPGLLGHALIQGRLYEPIIASTGFAVLRPRVGNDARFIFRLLFSEPVKRQIRILEVGSNYPAINESDVARLNVPKLSSSEQRAIADVLDTLDAAIRETEALIAKLKVLRLGLIDALLTRGIDDNGQLRRDEELDDTPIGKRPKNWQVAPLGTWLSGIDQGWSPDCSDEVTPVGEWGVLKTSSVVWEGYQDSENKRLPSTLPAREELVVQEGDVLMTRAGPGHRVAVVAYVDQTQGRLMLSDKLYRIRPAASLEPQYLALALSDHSAQRQLNAEKSGMAESQVNISQQGLRRILFPHPRGHEQQVIARVVRALDERITTDRSGAQKLFKLRDGLRDDLLTGRVRVAVVAEAAA